MNLRTDDRPPPRDAERTASSAAPPAAEERLLALVATMLRELRPGRAPRAIGLDDAIDRDLGLDSLSRSELGLRIEQTYGVRLADDLVLQARTLRELLPALTGEGARPVAATPIRVPGPVPEVSGVPEQAGTLVDAFRWHLDRHPDREHITLLGDDDGLEVVTYARLWDGAMETAHGMRRAGIVPGDAVALMLPTGVEFFQAFLGATLLGAVPVPLYPPLRRTEIEEHVRGRSAILANCEAKMLVTVAEGRLVAGLLRAWLPGLQVVADVATLRNGAEVPAIGPLAADSVALLQYTSGSTGDPKGVILTHANLLANIRAMGIATKARSTDRFVSWLPLYHDMGLIGAWLGTMYHAVPLVLMSPLRFLARPVRWLQAVDRFRGTMSGGPNFAYELVAAKVADEDLDGLDLSCWRLAFNGAEPVQAATLERFAARLARCGLSRAALTPVYGLAESAVGLAFPPLGRGPRIDRIDPRRLADDGRAVTAGPGVVPIDVVAAGGALPGHEIRVVDAQAREQPDRVEGAIEFRGPSATRGYWRNPAATAQLLRDGWLATGDVGYVADGELFVTSRAKDLIKRAGHNIHPYDCEAAVGDLPGIRKGCVAVFGTADPDAGTDRVIVVAETRETGLDARDQLRRQVAALATRHLDGPPDDVVLVAPRTLPKTSSGKLRRSSCRELYERRLLEAPRPAVWLQYATLARRAAAGLGRRALHRLADVAFAVRAWLAAGFFALVGAPLIAVLPGADRRLAVAGTLARLALRASGLPVTVRGLEHLEGLGPCVIVANHASYVDVPILAAVVPRPVRYAAKAELARVPLLGFLVRRLSVHFVERADTTRGVEDTRELVAEARQGQTLAFFPEGTFSRAPGLLPFRLGAFVVATQSRLPVVPIVLRGTRSVLRESRWRVARHPVHVEVQSPIRAAGDDWTAAVQLRDAVRAVFSARCGEPDLTG